MNNNNNTNNNNNIQYKIGDKVRIKPLEEFKKCKAYIPEMKEFADTIMTIESFRRGNDDYYEMKEDGRKWSFSYDMIEGLVSTTNTTPSTFTKNDLRSGDFVKDRTGWIGMYVNTGNYRTFIGRALWCDPDKYDVNFKRTDLGTNYDIISVFRPSEKCYCNFDSVFYEKCGTLVYDEKCDTTPSPSLLPCPFCSKTDTLLIETLSEEDYAVCCDITEGGCGSSSGYRCTEKEAIELWNTRN